MVTTTSSRRHLSPRSRAVDRMRRAIPRPNLTDQRRTALYVRSMPGRPATPRPCGGSTENDSTVPPRNWSNRVETASRHRRWGRWRVRCVGEQFNLTGPQTSGRDYHNLSMRNLELNSVYDMSCRCGMASNFAPTSTGPQRPAGIRCLCLRRLNFVKYKT